jgi:exportin-2 (importin alpha re-exporter)
MYLIANACGFSSQLVNYFPEILRIIYGRLDSPTVTESFKLRLTRFYHLVSALYDPQQGYGADFFIAASDSVQDGLFVPLYLKIILPLTQQLAKPLHRKCAAISLTKTLTHSEKFAIKYVKGWGLTCETLIKLLELAPILVADDSIVVEQDVDDLSFGVGFTPLNTCKPQPRDAWPEVTDIKTWVGTFYKDADRAQQGKLTKWASERLSPEISRAFFSYLSLSKA